LKIQSPLLVQRKKHFSPLVKIVAAGFKNNRKNVIFSRNSSMGLRQNEKQKKLWVKELSKKHISILICLFFITSQNACLNFFKTAFELLLYRKCGKRGSAI